LVLPLIAVAVWLSVALVLAPRMRPAEESPVSTR
jgi:hypothetical protein